MNRFIPFAVVISSIISTSALAANTYEFTCPSASQLQVSYIPSSGIRVEAPKTNGMPEDLGKWVQSNTEGQAGVKTESVEYSGVDHQTATCLYKFRFSNRPFNSPDTYVTLYLRPTGAVDSYNYGYIKEKSETIVATKK